MPLDIAVNVVQVLAAEKSIRFGAQWGPENLWDRVAIR